MTDASAEYFREELITALSVVAAVNNEIALIKRRIAAYKILTAIQVLVVLSPAFVTGSLQILGIWESSLGIQLTAAACGAFVSTFGMLFSQVSFHYTDKSSETIGSALNWLEERATSLADEAFSASIEKLRRDYAVVTAGSSR